MADRTHFILLTHGRTPEGDPLPGGEGGVAGSFTVVGTLSAGSGNHFALTSQEVTGGASTSARVVFEWTVPPDYIAGTDGELLVNAGVFSDPDVGNCSIDAEAWRLGPNDTELGDVVTTAAQSMSEGWSDYTFNLEGEALSPGDRLLIAVTISVKSDVGAAWAEVAQATITLDCEEAMSAEDVASLNVDSTGGTLTLAKALEAIVARCVGNLAYDTETGVATFYGRDGQTPIATTTLTGGGNRTNSSIP